MGDYYLLFKSLHIIAVVTWFAGIFYMPRLFVYFAEASEKNEPEKTILMDQFKIMQRRLWYGITWPSAIMVPLFAIYLLMAWDLKDNSWLLIKLIFVVGLYIYQLFLHKIFLQHKKSIIKYSPMKLRMINEISTLFLVAIVFLVVYKDTLSFAYAIAGLFIFVLVLLIGIKAYKYVRENKAN